MATFTDKTLAEADRNVFFNAGGSYAVRLGYANEVITLEQWRSGYGFDRSSVTADPQFIDPARGDYRVRDGSPALGLGFVNVDPATVGLKSDFPFKR